MAEPNMRRFVVAYDYALYRLDIHTADGETRQWLHDMPAERFAAVEDALKAFYVTWRERPISMMRYESPQKVCPRTMDRIAADWRATLERAFPNERFEVTTGETGFAERRAINEELDAFAHEWRRRT